MTLVYRYLTQEPGRDTRIAGRGVRIYTIISQYEMGDAAEYIADSKDLPLAAVFEALAYATEHPEEMDTIREADRAAEQRMAASLPEHLRKELETIREADDREHEELLRKAREARLGSFVP